MLAGFDYGGTGSPRIPLVFLGNPAVSSLCDLQFRAGERCASNATADTIAIPAEK